jgi:hypothetical protein
MRRVAWPVLGVSLAMALLYACGAAPVSVWRAQSGGGAGDDATGTLQVLVQTLALGGAPPGPGVASQPSTPTPIPSAVVHLRPAGADASADIEQVSDAQGTATFTVPAGTYWVYLPVGQNPDLAQAGAITPTLPDDTRVFAWSDATVGVGEVDTATLTVTIALP